MVIFAPPFYEVISQKIFFFTNDPFPYLSNRLFRLTLCEVIFFIATRVP